MDEKLKLNKNDPVSSLKNLNDDSIWPGANSKIEMTIAKAESEPR
jgi:hypothetical protein